MRRFTHLSFLSFIALCLNPWFVQPAGAQSILSIRVDASDAPRKILRAQLSIQVSPGPITLLYPKWIPGEHAPTGPITDLAGLRFTAGGMPVRWRRDPVNMFAFHLDVPAGAHLIEASLSYLSPPNSAGFSSGASTTTNLAVISWNQLLLYPEGTRAHDMICEPSLTLPTGWHFGTALAVKSSTPTRIDFKPVSLEHLIDSPVLAGAFFKSIDLSPGLTTPHFIDMAADSAAALEMSSAQLGHYRRLIREALSFFGAQHYERYHFLLSLSDQVAHFGLEHHESSDNRTWERALIDDQLRKLSADLLPHEMVHSWNGKYRRPRGLARSSYEEPMNTELLWVYEGLTQYLGDVLAVRSGLWNPEDYRQYLALAASNLELAAGRRWRPLADTAISAQLLYDARDDWASLRRGVDFYDEGALIWLEADVLIRQRSGGEKSLGDFCRLFFGPPNGPAAVKPYDLEDLIDTLTRVMPHDWSSFFSERVERITPHAPLKGIQESGWNLTYSEDIPPLMSAMEQARNMTYLNASLGLTIKEDGSITDLDPESVAGKSLLTPGMKISSVNGRPYSSLALRSAIKDGRRSKDPLELQADSAGFPKKISLDYHGGERYPCLVRDPAKPDLLDQILKPLTPR